MEDHAYDLLTINNETLKIDKNVSVLYLNKIKIPSQYIAKRKQAQSVFIGEWELIDNKLFLIDIKCKSKYDLGLNNSIGFAKQPKIFAKWFTGEVKTYEGRLIEYSSVYYGLINEINNYLKFKKGVLINKRSVINKPIIYVDPEEDLPF